MNPDFSPKLDLNTHVDYQSGGVVSKTLLKKPGGSITLFAFDEGQELSEHTAPFDAFLQVVAGECEVVLAGKSYRLRASQALLMPANEPHAVRAVQSFKMLLIMLKA